jgi:hypothetical protein
MGSLSLAAVEVVQEAGHEVATAVRAGGHLEVEPRGLGRWPPLKSFRSLATKSPPRYARAGISRSSHGVLVVGRR